MSEISILALFEEDYPGIEALIEQTEGVEIDFESVIRESLESSSFDDLDEFYRAKTSQEPTFFAELLVDDWIPWIELQGRRVTDDNPENHYFIHSIRSVAEIEFIKETFGDDIVVLAGSATDTAMADTADAVIKFDREPVATKITEVIVDELLDA